jgi:outer membrane protein TolC
VGRYNPGFATFVDVTTARSNAVQAAVNAVNGRYDYTIALATLRHAMGLSIQAATLGGAQ